MTENLKEWIGTRFWEFYAFLYDTLCLVLPYKELMEKTADCFEEHSGEGPILDAGCGTGNLEAVFARRFGRQDITGIDASSVMLSRASGKKGNANLVQADLDKSIPFADRTFSWVFAVNSLYSLKDPGFVLAEFKRVLDIGGMLVLVNPKTNPLVRNLILEHFRQMFRLPKRKMAGVLIKTLINSPFLAIVALLNFFVIKKRASKAVYHFFEKEELEKLLASCGFELLDSAYVYADTDVLAVARKKCDKPELKDIKKEVAVEVASTPEELEEIYRLRYEVYCGELGSLDPENYPDGKEIDFFDDYSVHFAAKYKNRTVGTMRFVKDTPKGFLMEDTFELPPNIDRKITVEYSRIIIHEKYRNLGLSDIIIKKARDWQVENGFTMGIGVASDEKLIPGLLKMGARQIGEPLEYHGSKATPFMLDLS